MRELSTAPLRGATVAANWTGRRLRRRRGRRAAIGAWWRGAKVALHLEPRRRRLTDPPIPHVAAATAGGAGVLMLIARRASRPKNETESPDHKRSAAQAASSGDQPQVGEEDVTDDARVENVQNMLHTADAREPITARDNPPV
jgi:hypothetical protein